MTTVSPHRHDAALSGHPTVRSEGADAPLGQGQPPRLVTTQPIPARGARVDLVIAGLLGLLALALRLATLTAQSAWVDEGYSMAAARHPVSFITEFTGRYDAHPPLHYLILHLWLGVFGAGVEQGRLLSALCGVGSVLALYSLARILYDRRTAACAALLLAVSPVALWFSIEIRMYAMAGMFALLALLCLVSATSQNRWWPWLTYAACAAAAFYTDYSATYILAAGALGALFMARTRQLAARWLTSQVLLCLLVAPGLPLLAHQSGNTAATAWITAPTLADVQAVAVNMVSRFTTMPVVVGLCACALALLGLVALAGDLGQPDGRRTALFVLCVTVAPFALPLLLSAFRPVFLTQSVVTTTFGLLILFARGAAWLATRFGRWALLVLAPVLLLNTASITTVAATPINEDWRGAARYLRQQATPTDVLIFDPRFLQLPFDLYWQGYGRSNPERGYPLDETLATSNPQPLATAGDLSKTTAGARYVWLLVRQGQETVSLPGDIAADQAGRWLLAHDALAGQKHLQGVSLYRFMGKRQVSDRTGPVGSVGLGETSGQGG